MSSINVISDNNTITVTGEEKSITVTGEDNNITIAGEEGSITVVGEETSIIIQASGSSIEVSEIGAQGAPGINAILSWNDYALNLMKYSGTKSTISTGRVLHGEASGASAYRYITDAKVGKYPSQDSFYSVFDGTVLSGLLATRGE
jgi:hypothetical protein